MALSFFIPESFTAKGDFLTFLVEGNEADSEMASLILEFIIYGGGVVSLPSVILALLYFAPSIYLSIEVVVLLGNSSPIMAIAPKNDRLALVSA